MSPEISYVLRAVAGLMALLILVRFVWFVVKQERIKRQKLNGPADADPVTPDNILLAEGELAAFDSRGSLLIWIPAPGDEKQTIILRNDVTLLAYEDMPKATPRMRDNLRLLKGGKLYAERQQGEDHSV